MVADTGRVQGALCVNHGCIHYWLVVDAFCVSNYSILVQTSPNRCPCAFEATILSVCTPDVMNPPCMQAPARWA